jgi:hypothetical protein
VGFLAAHDIPKPVMKPDRGLDKDSLPSAGKKTFVHFNTDRLIPPAREHGGVTVKEGLSVGGLPMSYEGLRMLRAA